MKLLKIKYFLFIALYSLFAQSLNNAYSQDLVQDIGSDVSVADNREMFTETIRIIGRSYRVFILTNTNQMLFKGDFITLVLGERDAVARAVVAKNQNELIGIKILRIYSLKNWKKLKKNLDVKILKGDDSWLFTKAPKRNDKRVDENDLKINSEEDLYNDNLIGKDLDSFGKDSRLIKPDNIVTGMFSQYTLKNQFADGGLGETQKYNRLTGSWNYQFADNYWVEGSYGRVTMNSVPASGLQTAVNEFTFRLKYTFQAPLYSYFMPYIGYQIMSVSSPEAAKSGNVTVDAEEETFIQGLGKSKLVVGVTILRRLVPGWFIKLDIGSEVTGVGFGIEF